MSDDFRTWWEIPSIVHFCKVLSPVCKDLSPININEFEHAVDQNSLLLTDMAIRFMKICGYFDSNLNELWTAMKALFQNKCVIYNFKYPLGSVSNFADLTPKQKVEALYILCHIVLDVDSVQHEISNNPKLWPMFNVKPLGYDLNNSVYWYFGTTRLYREDFENKLNSPVTSSVLNDFHHNSYMQPYSSELSKLGQWNTICDDDKDSWYSLADSTKYSKNASIQSLHNSIYNIIMKLPQVKRNKSHYKYFNRKLIRNIRSTSHCYMDDKNNSCTFIDNSVSANDNRFSQHFEKNQTKNNENKCIQTQNAYKDTNKSIKRLSGGTLKLEFSVVNRIKTRSTNIQNIDGPNLSKPCQPRLKNKVLDNIDQENNTSFGNLSHRYD